MLYEYAIDPSLFSDSNNCQNIFESFKIERGRVVANIPNTWQREVLKEISGKPLMRKTIKEHLKKLVRESLCKNRPSLKWERQSESWCRLVSNEHEKYPVSAVLSEQCTGELVKAFRLSELLFESPDCWTEPSEKSVARKAHNIIDAMMPLLRLSREVTLIDMHLYPGDVNSRRVLIELLRRVPELNFGRGIKKITIHSSDHRKDLKNSLNQHLLSHLPQDLVLEYRLWPKSKEHDRFIVTEMGGIVLGHGFSENRNIDANDVFMSLIGHEKRHSLKANFSGQPTYLASIYK